MLAKKSNNKQNILEVQDLSVYFETKRQTTKAVDHVSFSLAQGEILGIVGESGSGKSTLACSILRMIPQPNGRLVSGSILYKGMDLLTCKNINQIRGKEISMIMQNAMSVLDPVFTVGDQLMEKIRVKSALNKTEAHDLAIEILQLLEFNRPQQIMNAYPYELSGGMRQRILIGLAIANQPSIVIADEPTTALDVIVQKRIILLMKKIVRQRNISLILVTHNFGLIWELCDRALVMKNGKIVESAGVLELYRQPIHPYTKALLRSIPTFDTDPLTPLPTIEEEMNDSTAWARNHRTATADHYTSFEKYTGYHV